MKNKAYCNSVFTSIFTSIFIYILFNVFIGYLCKWVLLYMCVDYSTPMNLMIAYKFMYINASDRKISDLLN